VPVLSRLIDHFNVQLFEYAAGREHELPSFELPLFVDEMREGVPYRHWVLWNDRICTLLHSFREIARMAWQRFTIPHQQWTMNEVRSQYAIQTMAHLLTDEDRPGFSWL
jgi:hypothetical protein